MHKEALEKSCFEGSTVFLIHALKNGEWLLKSGKKVNSG
jgi:hypothetical protein